MNDKHQFNIFDKIEKDNSIRRLRSEKDIKNIAVAIFCSMAFCFSMFAFIERFSDDLLCRFSSDKLLLYIWPPNASIIDTLNLTNYTIREKCEFIALRSLASATLLPYLVFSIISKAIYSDAFYKKGELLPFVFILCLAAYTAFDPLYPYHSRFHLSSMSGFTENLLKSYVYVYGIYFCLFMINSRFFSYLRASVSNAKGEL